MRHPTWLTLSIILWLSGWSTAQEANPVPKIKVQPVAPVHIGKSTQFEILFEYNNPNPPLDLKLSSDKGLISSVTKIGDGKFSAILFTLPFQAEDEYKVSFAPKGQASAKRSLMLRPSRYAVPEFMPKLSVNLEPERVTLGRDKSVRITVNLSKPDGSAYSTANLSAEVNTGTLSAFQHIGNGAYVATYTPPSQQFPDVAMLIIQDVRHGLVEAVPIPMWGYEDFPIDSRPNSEVRLIVGAETFGPVVTNFRGVARIPIIVAPGIKTATQLEKLADGKTIRKVVDLATPPIQKFYGVVVPSRIQAGEKAQVHVFTAPLQQETNTISLDLESEVGKFELLRQVKANHSLATFIAPKTLEQNSTDIYVLENLIDRPEELLDFEQQRTYLSTVEFFPGFPQRVVVTAAPTRLVTKVPPKRVFATIEVIDPHGNPVPNVEIAAELPGTRIGPIDDQGDGTYKVGILPTTEVRTAQKAEFVVKAPAIEAQVKAAQLISKAAPTPEQTKPAQPQGASTDMPVKTQPAQAAATFEIKLAYTEPGRIRFIDPPQSLAGGNRERRILFEVLDKENTKLAGEEMIANASRGTIVSLVALPDGNYALTYRPPERGGSPASITVREKNGQLAETIKIEITQPFFEISLLPSFGYMLNAGLNRSPRLTLKVDLMSHQIANGRLGLQVGGGFYGRNTNIPVDLGNGIQATTRAFFWVTPLHAGLISYLPVPVVELHAGLMFNYCLVSAGQISNPGSASLIAPSATFSTVMGGEIHTRGAFKLGIGKPFFDLAYALAKLKNNAGATGEIGGFSLQLGYMFSF